MPSTDRTRAMVLGLTLLAAGCAPTVAKLPPPETLAELVCDARARDEAKQAPGVLRTGLAAARQRFATATPADLVVGSIGALANLPIGAALLVAAPAWYPVARSRHEDTLYRQFYLSCLAEPPSE